MRRASDLLGLPVLDAEDRQIGTVREILISLAQGRLVALVMPVKVLAEPDLLAVEHAREIGPDCARLLDRVKGIRGEKAQKLRQNTMTLERVRKLTVITRSGNRLGNVEDVILDGCRIEALELSDGLIQDIFQGRDTIRLTGEASVEDENLVVPDGTRFLPQEDGRQGAWRHDQGF